MLYECACVLYTTRASKHAAAPKALPFNSNVNSKYSYRTETKTTRVPSEWTNEQLMFCWGQLEQRDKILDHRESKGILALLFVLTSVLAFCPPVGLQGHQCVYMKLLDWQIPFYTSAPVSRNGCLCFVAM